MHDAHHGPVLSFELAHQGDALGRGGHRCIEQQASLELHRGHADGHGHEKHPLELLKAPDLAGHQLTAQRAPAAKGIEGQQRPPNPVLVNRLSSAYRHAICQWCLNCAEPTAAGDSAHGHLAW